MPTHYQLLSLPPTATPEQIRRAYRTLAKTLHPDVNPSADAAKKFSKLAAAYQTLSNPAKRKRCATTTSRDSTASLRASSTSACNARAVSLV